MAVRAETLLPKDREAALAMAARRLALVAKTLNKLPSPLTSTTMDQSPPSTLVPLAHTPSATNFGPPTFDNTIQAFDLAHRLVVEPSCQTIRTLNQ